MTKSKTARKTSVRLSLDDRIARNEQKNDKLKVLKQIRDLRASLKKS